MKSVLITGKNSYIGTSVEKWLMRESDKYLVNTIDVRGNEWKEHDFSKYDVVLHVAGIVHQKEKKNMKDLYMKVNCDLTIELAQKAKSQGVSQFIFMSTMAVYGNSNEVIDKETPLKPNTLYGKSKLDAEVRLEKLFEDRKNDLLIIRPPMIYGKNCLGNYTLLRNIMLKIPFFINIQNKRSMIYILNLTNFIENMIDSKEYGIVLPQNKEYISTRNLVERICHEHDIKVTYLDFIIPLVKFLMRINFSRKIDSIFGNLTYDIASSITEFSNIDFNESIRQTEVIHD